MDPIFEVIKQVGTGAAASVLGDFIKQKLKSSNILLRDEFEKELQDKITLEGVDVSASTVVSALAQNGLIKIDGSNLYAPQSLVFGSSASRKASVGNNSTMNTDKTSIVAGTNAFMETQGNAQVRQNPDGSISFHAG